VISPLDRRSQVLDQAHPVADAVNLLVVDREVLVFGLGPIHRQVGASEQVMAVGRVSRHRRDPDAGADPCARRAEIKRLLQQRCDPLRDRRRVLRVGVRQGHRELVAAQPDNQVRRSQ
jgi:hypothetical protein